MQKPMWASLAVSLIVFVIPIRILGQNIPVLEKIRIDPAADFQFAPRSLSLTEDKLFLIPDHKSGAVKAFIKEGTFLKFIKSFNGSESGNEKFALPMYCCYSREESKLAVIDNGAKKIFLFFRSGKVDFRLIKTFLSRGGGGYDIEFASGGRQLVVSGYLIDEENNPFDLYKVDAASGKIDYLLPSPQKYGLQTIEDYISEYRVKQTIPAIGIKAFIAVREKALFFVWEGALRIIKMNLGTQEPKVEKTFGHEATHYIKPDPLILGKPYSKGDFQATWDKQKKYAYVRKIFASSRHLFVVYETAKNNMSNAPEYRLQTYTLEGAYLTDVSIPGNPGPQMYFDPVTDELYAFSGQSGNGNKELSLLKYQISR